MEWRRLALMQNCGARLNAIASASEGQFQATASLGLPNILRTLASVWSLQNLQLLKRDTTTTALKLKRM